MALVGDDGGHGARLAEARARPPDGNVARVIAATAAT